MTLLDETAQVSSAQQLVGFKLPPASSGDTAVVQVAVTPEWRADDSTHTSYYYISYRMSPALPATPPAAEGADGGGSPAPKLDPGLYDAGLDPSLDVKVCMCVLKKQHKEARPDGAAVTYGYLLNTEPFTGFHPSVRRADGAHGHAVQACAGGQQRLQDAGQQHSHARAGHQVLQGTVCGAA